MAKRRDIKYTRLPGRNMTSCSLWMANDHILNVETRAFSEEYKRFYFHDIQAIITQKTESGKILNSILGGIGGISVVIAFGNPEFDEMLFWLIIAGIFGGILFINWLLGPTCSCYIITAVQQSKLPSLSRLRAAKKVAGILRRHIGEVQGRSQ